MRYVCGNLGFLTLFLILSACNPVEEAKAPEDSAAKEELLDEDEGSPEDEGDGTEELESEVSSASFQGSGDKPALLARGSDGSSLALFSFSSSTFVSSLGALENVGGDDLALVKISQDGNVSWVRQIGGTSSEHALAMLPDGAGGVVLALRSDSSSLLLGGAFDQSPATLQHLYIVRYDSTGSVSWVNAYTSDYEVAQILSWFGDKFKMIADSEGGLLFSLYPRFVRLDLATGTELINIDWSTLNSVSFSSNHYVTAEAAPESGGASVLIKTYDLDATLLWTRSIEWIDTSYQGVYLALDDAGYVYAGGLFAGQLNFVEDSLSLLRTYANGSGYANGFISKFSTAGDLIWAKSIEAELQNFAFAVDPSGRVGAYADTPGLGVSIDEVVVAPSVGNWARLQIAFEADSTLIAADLLVGQGFPTYYQPIFFIGDTMYYEEYGTRYKTARAGDPAIDLPVAHIPTSGWSYHSSDASLKLFGGMYDSELNSAELGISASHVGGTDAFVFSAQGDGTGSAPFFIRGNGDDSIEGAIVGSDETLIEELLVKTSSTTLAVSNGLEIPMSAPGWVLILDLESSN
jgi:hypothetical protein